MTKAGQGGKGLAAKAERPRARTLGVAVGLAAFHSLWALFQWTELVVVRRGGEAYCVLGQGDACAAAWNSAFASAVQSWTGLPVAAWGLVWSGTALTMPLAALVRRARSEPAEPFWSATLLTALAGAGVVMGLAAQLMASGRVCTTCATTYALVLTYALVCFLESRQMRGADMARGGAIAAGMSALFFLLLLYPGLRTPPGPGSSREAAFAAPASGSVEERLAALVGSLEPEHRQLLADALAAYAQAPAVPVRPARWLVGSAQAPVRITEFADVLCGHCAMLNRTLAALRERLPADAFAIEPRWFPLDPACNPALAGESRQPVRCLAAKAAICVENEPDAYRFADDLFENQEDLSPERVFDLAAPWMPRDRLQACIDSDETEARLRSDLEWAEAHQIRGTPLVLVNGREALPYPPLLYALVLTRGSATHPAFAGLPPPRPLGP